MAQLEYTAPAWGPSIDGFVQQVWPIVLTLLGSAIIVGSGLYGLRDEQAHATAEHP